ncbi:SOS response-associated peptidase [Fodinicola acaciae]|uniref:SOS response-associated peptidase n=1 Tax=Fodinicola acaciae TaxID=2681555 RepID=UPI0013D0BE22|nr:SOS response-associated peptidase [Fodinicola acaciae]
MCGRYATTRSADELSTLFDAALADMARERLRVSYNVAPTDPVPIVRMSHRDRDNPKRVLDVVRWGLVPGWAKDLRTGAKFINARADSLDNKPAFRTAYARRRAIVPADGWYEWKPLEDQPGKQAFYMTPKDGSVLAFAGLWEVWGSGDERVLSCSVVTTDAVGHLAQVHDRMPLILTPDRWSGWLAAEDGLLTPPPAKVLDAIELRPVGSAVGNVKNNYPELRDEVPQEPEQLTLGS